MLCEGKHFPSKKQKLHCLFSKNMKKSRLPLPYLSFFTNFVDKIKKLKLNEETHEIYRIQCGSE
jgi:hypothetical protein